MHLKNLAIIVISLLLLPITAKATSLRNSSAMSRAQINYILRGSRQSLDKQMLMAKRLHFPIIKNDRDIRRMYNRHELFNLPWQGEGFYLDPDIGSLDSNNRELYTLVRMPVVKFISILGRDFKDRFNKRLKITSLVRTMEYQKKLQHHNANATDVSRSAHLTGAAIDISYKETTREELDWMRARLARLESENLLEATEERFQACFHVMVFRE